MAERVNTTTSTQIRNFYSEGLSYLNVKFFNTNLSFQFYPFQSKDNLGKSTYDMKNGQITTVNFEGAAALHLVAEDIIAGKIQECDLPIPCASGASLNISRKLGQSGRMETTFSITKNGITIPFVFQTMTVQVKENGQITSHIIESGLKAFSSTVKGYLEGINADRHLDKLTDDFAKLQNNQQSNNQGNNNYNRNNYNNNKKYQNNNNNGYRKQYNNNNGYNNGNNQNWQQQNMSSYEIKN